MFGSGVTPTYLETSWGAYDAPFCERLCMPGCNEIRGQSCSYRSSESWLSSALHTSLLLAGIQPSWRPLCCSIYDSRFSKFCHFPGLLPIGATSFSVQAEPGSYVAISMNGVLHGAALANDFGNAEVTIDPFTTAGTADIIVTKPQYQPVLTSVVVATPAVVNITPSSMPINTLTDVTIDVFEDDGTTPIPNVNILITDLVCMEQLQVLLMLQVVVP